MLALGEAESLTEDALEFLHLAAVASLTEVAVEEAKEEVEQNLRGSFLEELRAKPDELDPHEVVRRAARLGCDLARGAVVLCAELSTDRPRHVVATISGEYPGALAQHMELPGSAPRVYALLPGSGGDGAAEATLGAARRLAARLQRHGTVGLSSFYADPGELGRAIQEAELVLDVLRRSDVPINEDIGTGTYRLLFRVLASHPEEVRSFYEDTVAPIVKYDDQYATDLVGTLEAYLEQNCNMNATAAAIYAHRHTVAYRLDRVKELTSLDPMQSEDRERLGLGPQGVPHHRAAPATLTVVNCLTPGARRSSRAAHWPITQADMRSRLLLPILLAVTAALGAAAPAHALEVGLNKTLGNTVPFADKTKDLGAGWVRIWGEWEDAEPAPGQWRPDVINNMNADANAAKAKGLKVLMVVQRSPAWASNGKGGTAPPTDPKTFGRAMGELAKRVPNVDAWELWNEEDSERFFAGGAEPGQVRGDGQVRLPGDQGRAAGRRRRDRRDHGQQLRVHRGPLRPRPQGPLRRDRHAHGHGVPDRRPEPPVPGARRAPRPLHLLELPRDPRGDAAPRGRRQADLDDRARLGDALHGPELVRRRQVGGPEGRGRDRGPAGASSSRRPTSAWPPTRTSASPSGSACRTSRAAPPAATASSATTATPSRRSSAFRGALARHRARALRRPDRPVGPADQGQRAPGRPRLPQGDGHRRQGDRPRRRRHQGHRAPDRRQVLPLLRRRQREDADPLGLARVAQRHEAHS